jgi:hypothetical protein
MPLMTERIKGTIYFKKVLRIALEYCVMRIPKTHDA